jgi:type VI secretion system protein VasG
MLNMNLGALVAALDAQARVALEEAAALCVSRGGHEVGVEDFVEKLLESRDVQDVLAQFGIAVDAVRQQLLKRPQGKGGASGRPVFSPLLIELLQEAWLLASLELGHGSVGGHALMLALLLNPARYSIMGFYRELGRIPADELKRLLEGLPSAGGGAAASPASAGESNLKKFAIDFMEEARRGAIDPVFARGPELRQIIDILTRRRKNNPILVGDPGVGKTAVVEGLALRIVDGNVPDALTGVKVIGLDMGRLQAGAGVKGEFEKRLKGIIDEVKGSPTPIILFIDEAHTLVGSGNSSGGDDGANLLKPALARGELRTIAATTWSEYKKYFEKDAALARRFQLVKLDEPSLSETVTILRGIVPHYEKVHQVYIRDDAVLQTAELSTRYISGRYQPDKAIDVLDTACARVRVSLGAKPAGLEYREEELAAIRRELTALERDGHQGLSAEKNAVSAARHAVLQGDVAAVEEIILDLRQRWEQENALVRDILALRTGQDSAAEQTATTDTPPFGNTGEGAGTLSEGVDTRGTRDRNIIRLRAELRAVQGEDPLVFFEVTPRLVASIVAEWTGIPLEKIGEEAAGKLARLGDRLRGRIKGQEFALQNLEKAVITSRTGMNSPGSPTAIFLLVGPSGTGKTETALAVADELYGGERSIISINMSEFQEKHTISRLIGSPPGYVGYGEGGRLTEAVRRQPYSVVLFDEVEKAHPEVLNLFYQMFDKGVLADGEGREIDFRNTMIFLTSNLGSDIIAAMCEGNEAPDPALLREALRPMLTQFFKPALLGRMTVVPYMSINPETMRELVAIKLNRVAERLMARHRITLAWNEDVAGSIAASCTAVDTGARNIDHIINSTLLPGIASILLGSLSDNVKISSLHIGLDAAGGSFTYQCAGENRT